MKQYIKLSLILVLTLSAGHIHAQSLDYVILPRTRSEVQGKWEWNNLNNLDLNYYNEDFCDYYLYREMDQSYNLPPGKTTVYTKDFESEVDNAFKEWSYYYICRGKFPDKFKITTPYALPVKSGKKVNWETNQRESRKTMQFRLNQRDTIYATRAGVACRLLHADHLLIYHADNTFAAYISLLENFVQPGEIILTGQPIGLAGSNGISISYFFLDKNKFTGEKFNGYPYSHFTPMFRTNEGDMKLEERSFYQALTDDELIMQDMDKREKKKYLKQKSQK